MRNPHTRPTSRLSATIASLVLVASVPGCAGSPAPDRPEPAGPAGTGGVDFAYDASVPAPEPGADPVEVWDLQRQKMQTLADWFDRVEAQLDALEEQGASEEEMEAVMADLKAASNRVATPAILAPYVTDAALRELESWDAMPWEDRVDRYAMIAISLVPSEFEVLNREIDGDTALLELRGYFERPLFSDPGWYNGMVRLERERGEWRVEKEEWGDG